MEKGLRKYAIICIAVTAFACVFLHALALLSTKVTDGLNEKYAAYYRDGVKGVSAPWYRDGLHIVDEGFITELAEKKPEDSDFIAIGSSMSIICFGSKYDPQDRFRFLVCGNGCWKSDRQLYELYRASGKENKNDVIKLEFSFSTFRNMETSITQTILDKWGRYTALEDGRIKTGTPVLAPVYALNLDLMRIQNLWELGKSLAFSEVNSLESKEKVPGNFLNNYFNYDAVADTCNMTEEMKDHMRELIEDISADHILVAELSPLPEGLSETDFGRQLESYMDEELIPMLTERGIPYLDYRRDFEDSEFCDGVHLGYDASLRYTEKLRKDMEKIGADYGVTDDAG